jgi:hypothetical protein
MGTLPLLFLGCNWARFSRLLLRSFVSSISADTIGISDSTRHARNGFDSKRAHCKTVENQELENNRLNSARFGLVRTWDALSRSDASRSSSAFRTHLVVSQPHAQTCVQNLGSVTANNLRPTSISRKSEQHPTECNPTCQVGPFWNWRLSSLDE